MNVQFDDLIDRRGSTSAKWAPHRFLSPDDASADPLPMWVADMDFRSPPPIIEALEKAVREGVFGYPHRTRAYEEAVCQWQVKRFGWTAEPSWLVQTPGVITALGVIIQEFTSPGDAVLIQPPVYGHFFIDVRLNGRQVKEAPLVLGETSYTFDAAAFEAAITPETRLFFLCNPHNPTGNVWSRADLRAMGEICFRHDILVISDEIHQDLIFDKTKRHIPFASLGEEFAANSIICTSPSKTFNLAGLQCSNIFVSNDKVRGRLQRALVRSGLNFVNTLGAAACEAAYRDGEPWLDELLGYIAENHKHFANAVHRRIPQLRVFESGALYLAWMDCRRLMMDVNTLESFLLTKARVWFDSGSKFGKQGEGFMRINLGCPRATIDEALSRLTSAMDKIL